MAPRGFLAAPCFPVALALASAPSVVVLQSKAMAPLALIALALTIVAHWRRHGALPWPSGGVAMAALALGLWGAASAFWAIEPLRSLESGLAFAAMALLAGGAARAVALDTADAKARLAGIAAVGLVVGLALAAVDHVSGNAVRAFVRGIRDAPATLAFGLKPAASVLAMLLPLAAAAPRLSARLRLAILIAGAAVIVALPGDSAKIAALLGLALLALGTRWPARAIIPTGALLGAAVIAMPLILGAVFARGIPGEALPFSATHRLLIWDFSIARIAERPLLGWGMEASRAVPGGAGTASAEALDRFAITSAPLREVFALPQVQILPLHPHNGALQIWLELGLVGALLAGTLLLLLGLAASRATHPPVAIAVLMAAFVTGMLSFGVWQAWWIAAQLLALVAVAALPNSQQ